MSLLIYSLELINDLQWILAFLTISDTLPVGGCLAQALKPEMVER